uniref:Fibronectin type-III domain-containing protein n=1 Tax=Pseudonaja textilis TaxID=8673 RepID=A0A670XYN1_PSETE
MPKKGDGTTSLQRILVHSRVFILSKPLHLISSHCLLPSPRNVSFISRNMKNILHWLPPEGIVENKLNYKVKYLMYVGYWVLHLRLCHTPGWILKVHFATGVS